MMACSSVPGESTKTRLSEMKEHITRQINILIDYFQRTEPFAGLADGLDVGDRIKILIGHDSGLKETQDRCHTDVQKQLSDHIKLIRASVN